VKLGHILDFLAVFFAGWCVFVAWLKAYYFYVWYFQEVSRMYVLSNSLTGAEGKDSMYE
jgi:hypothetical protein